MLNCIFCLLAVFTAQTVSANYVLYPLSAAWKLSQPAPDSPVASYLGGNGADNIYAITTNDQGDLFIAGSTTSSRFDPLPRLINTRKQDMFIARFSGDPRRPGFIAFLQGSEFETVRAITLDQDGHLWFVGESSSPDLPVSHPNYPYQGSWDVYFGRINSETGELMTSGYLGGSHIDYGHAITVNAARQVAIGGETWSSNFPVTKGGFMRRCAALECPPEGNPHKDGFVTVLNGILPGAWPVYSSYFGGEKDDGIHAIAWDSMSHLHIAGNTWSTDLPLKLPIQTRYNNGNDAFYLRLAPMESRENSLLAASYLGGSGEDRINAIHVDDANNIWLAGYSHSRDWPTTRQALDKSCGDSLQACNTDRSDMIIARINHDQPTRLAFSTFWGGQGNDRAQAIDSQGEHIVVAGITYSDNFPLTQRLPEACLDEQCAKHGHGAVLQLNRQNNRLFLSQKLAGNANVQFNGVLINHHIMVAGTTTSSDLGLTTSPDVYCGFDGRCDASDGRMLRDGLLVGLTRSDQQAEIIAGGDMLPAQRQRARARRERFFATMSNLSWLLLLLIPIVRITTNGVKCRFPLH